MVKPCNRSKLPLIWNVLLMLTLYWSKIDGQVLHQYGWKEHSSHKQSLKVTWQECINPLRKATIYSLPQSTLVVTSICFFSQETYLSNPSIRFSGVQQDFQEQESVVLDKICMNCNDKLSICNPMHHTCRTERE